jgi:hypothetical protein
MTPKAGHTFTAGPWDYFVGNANGRGLVRVEAAISSDDAGEHICSFPRGSKGEAHAALLAEAGTVLHEAGLTPRQLAEQRDELLAALQWALAELDKSTSYAHPGQFLACDTRARAAIAKATAGGAV